ncbi:MAG: tetratricopeptide repeat protein [Planctomycetes bacterium]|nr:tetratricopeptide repeat protein [Planctomycetota bacterium]
MNPPSELMPRDRRFDQDPCTQIQIDLSAMLDGELDPASVRRVMVHSDVCPSCARFLEGIRLQARSHRQLHAVLTATPEQRIAVPCDYGTVRYGDRARVEGTLSVRVADLRRQLTENRRQLARIFYELGRGFVLLGISPNFSRVVAREPVPIPDMYQRGKILLDEVARLAGPDAEAVGQEWVLARDLFGESWSRSPEDNLRKGIELLRETLSLDPDCHEARIYLGHAFHVAGCADDACAEFRAVLDRAEDLGTRGFALLNLGNVHLDAGRPGEAQQLFLELVESGAVRLRPQFGLIYFNLALTYGMQGRYEECRTWLERLDTELPHKRRMIADEFRNRGDFVASLSRNPEIYRQLSDRFPSWFPKKEAC